MAKHNTAKTRHASTKPSEAEQGAIIGFPTGSEVTITEAAWTTWEEAGEKAIKGGRNENDPALKVVGEVEGVDDPITEFLGAGKEGRLAPSEDGEYLDVPDGSTATALSDSCNANVFLKSLVGLGADEDLMEDGISAFLVGTKFVAGRVIVERNFQVDDGARKPKPTLVAEEIIELSEAQGGGAPKKGGKGKPAVSAKSAKPAKPSRSEAAETAKSSKTKTKAAKEEEDEEDEEDEETDSGSDSENDTAEAFVLEALDIPKYGKGLPLKGAFAAVYNLVRDQDPEIREAVTGLVKDKKWVGDEDRPWTVDDDGMIQKA